MWKFPGLISPTCVDGCPSFSEFKIAELPDFIISGSGVVSSHIVLLHDDLCMPLIIHHEVRDLTWFLHWCNEQGEAAAAHAKFFLHFSTF